MVADNRGRLSLPLAEADRRVASAVPPTVYVMHGIARLVRSGESAERLRAASDAEVALAATVTRICSTPRVLGTGPYAR